MNEDGKERLVDQAHLWTLLNTRQALARETTALLIFTTTVALVLDLLFAEHVPSVVYLAAFTPFLAIYIGSYWLLHRGSYRAAALLLTGGTVLAQLGVAYYAKGQEAQALVSFVNLVLIAGFLLGPLAAILTSILGSSSVVLYFYLSATNQLPDPTVVTGSSAGAIALGTTILTTGGLVFIAIRHLRAALIQERQARELANLATADLEQAQFDADYRALLAEHLVTIGAQFIELGRPSELAHRLCEALCLSLGTRRAWVVGRGGAILGRGEASYEGAAMPQGGEGTFPLTLKDSADPTHLDAGQLANLRAWAQLDDLDEAAVVGVPGAGTVHLVTAGALETCRSDTSVAFLSAAAGLLASGLARTKAEERLRQTQRMDAVGRMSAGLAHDFNNLLTAITAGTELVKVRLARGLEVDAQVQAIESATERAASLTKRLMAFTAAEARTPEAVNITALVAGMLAMLQRIIEERVTLEADLPAEPLWIRADPVEVERAIMNLVINARDAIADSGTVAVTLSHALETVPGHVEPQTSVVLTVQDDGEGMSAEIERRIFEPFFTTRKDKGGHGLGLSAVYGLAKATGGRVSVRSRPGEGARFDLILPIVAAPSAATPALRLAGAPQRHRARLLVVEDSDDVRSLLTEVLSDADYQVVAVKDGVYALDFLKQDDCIDLVISDVVMPRLGGIELAEQVQSDYPGLPVVLMSGYAPNEKELPRVQRLHKPFAIDALLEAVAQALSAASTAEEQATETRSG